MQGREGTELGDWGREIEEQKEIRILHSCILRRRHSRMYSS